MPDYNEAVERGVEAALEAYQEYAASHAERHEPASHDDALRFALHIYHETVAPSLTAVGANEPRDTVSFHGSPPREKATPAGESQGERRWVVLALDPDMRTRAYGPYLSVDEAETDAKLLPRWYAWQVTKCGNMADIV